MSTHKTFTYSMSLCNTILKLIYIKREGFFQVFIMWMLIYIPNPQEKPIASALSAWQLSFSNVVIHLLKWLKVLAVLMLFNNLLIRICLLNRSTTSALYVLSSVQIFRITAGQVSKRHNFEEQVVLGEHISI